MSTRLWHPIALRSTYQTFLNINMPKWYAVRVGKQGPKIYENWDAVCLSLKFHDFVMLKLSRSVPPNSARKMSV